MLTCWEKVVLVSGMEFVKEWRRCGGVEVGILISVDWIAHMFQWECLAKQISGQNLPCNVEWGEDTSEGQINSLQFKDRKSTLKVVFSFTAGS
jgi:hypothetical protein